MRLPTSTVSSPRWLALATGLAVACGGSGAAEPDAGLGDAGLEDAGLEDAGRDAGAATDVFDVWIELQERLRASPDHLPERAADVVASGDPEAIFTFVRDTIAVFPKSAGLDFTGPGWGPRATLRSGVGTVHDKAALLVQLFQEAGFEASVQSTILPFERRDASPVFGSLPARSFAPPITPEDLQRWEGMLGVDALPASALAIVDPDGSVVAPWAAAITDALTPEDPFVPQAELDGFTPLAVVELDGVPTSANAVFPDATLGDLERFGPRDFGPYDEVSVRLWARRNHTDAAGEDVTLVERTFGTDEVTGRRVVVRAPPILGFRELLLVRPEDVGARLPVIEVAGHGVDEDVRMALNAAGAPLNVRGERIEVTPEGDLRIEGVPFPVDEDEAERLGRVASATAQADAATFPEVRLSVALRDAEGASVEGLSGRPFVVEEDGARMFHRLRRNTARLRVQLVFDFSLSMPPELTGENAVQLGLDVGRQVFALPNAEVSASVLGAAFQPWTSDPSALEAQLRSIDGRSSALWRTMSEAEARDPDLVVVVSDGWPDDMPFAEEARAAIARGGAPILFLKSPPVGEGAMDISGELAALTGGQVVPVTDRASSAAALETYLGSFDRPPYEVLYPAPREGPATRAVRVALDGTPAEATTSYEVPATGAGVYGMTGLYLTVAIDGDAVTRRIAGAPVDPDERPSTQADVDAVKAALMGSYVLGFEGGAPPLSVALDEWLGDMLTYREVVRRRGDFEAWVEAMEAGVRRPVPELYATAALARYEGAGSHTFVARPRPVLVSRTPRFGVGRDRRVDILPLAPWATMGPEPAAAWDLSVARSLHLAAVEGALFPTSTLGELEGEDLMAMPARNVRAAFRDTPNEDRWNAVMAPYLGFGEYSVLVPRDGDPVAFWAVHEETGSTLGVLPDGSGGGYEEVRARVEANLRFFDMLEEAADTAGVSGGVWLSLELEKARVVSWATLWIGYLGEGPDVEPPPGVDDVEEAVAEWVRGELEGRALDALPEGYSDAIGDAMEVLGLVSDAAGLAD
ncbi:MAG: hypothetical protein AAF447_21945 [Myxococcota bacterium]